MLQQLKQQLRKDSKTKLKNLSSEDKDVYSKNISLNIINAIKDLEIKDIALYYPTKIEPNISLVFDFCFQSLINVYLPKSIHSTYSFVNFNKNSKLIHGPFSIKEPESVDVMNSNNPNALYIVPGIIFDVNGHRIGHGKGIYDRLLRNVNGIKIGAAFSCQLINNIPYDDHDVLLDSVITEIN